MQKFRVKACGNLGGKEEVSFGCPPGIRIPISRSRICNPPKCADTPCQQLAGHIPDFTPLLLTYMQTLRDPRYTVSDISADTDADTGRAAVQITDRAMKSLRAPKHGNLIFWDDDIAGFGARITAAGAVAFILNYRINGRQRRHTIARWPAWFADAARDEAKDLWKDIRRGIDPQESRERQRTEPTVAELAADYLERHAQPYKRPGLSETI